MTDDVIEFFGPVISTYTRAQALADGVLVDAGAMAREAGFRHPVALTGSVWSDCVAWSETDSDTQTIQDQTGRLWDVLYMAAWAIRSQHDDRSVLLFDLYRVPRDGRSKEAELTPLKLLVGPGDHGEPVITIMLPCED